MNGVDTISLKTHALGAVRVISYIDTGKDESIYHVYRNKAASFQIIFLTYFFSQGIYLIGLKNKSCSNEYYF